jgi:hypothetical protein
MSTEKVSWQYKNGVKSFLNLWNMIETSLESLQEEGFLHKFTIKITKSHGGFYLDDDFWVGIQLDDPEKIFFGYNHHTKNNKFFKDTINLSGQNIPARVYDFNENHFFELPRDEQQKGVFNFIKECLEIVKLKSNNE